MTEFDMSKENTFESPIGSVAYYWLRKLKALLCKTEEPTF